MSFSRFTKFLLIALVFVSSLAFSDVATMFKGGWADKVLYMIMIDRFNDGDPSNNRSSRCRVRSKRWCKVQSSRSGRRDHR